MGVCHQPSLPRVIICLLSKCSTAVTVLYVLSSCAQRVARERSCGGGRSRSAASERQHARQPSACCLGRPLGRFAGGGAGGQPQRTPVVATHASTRGKTDCQGCARCGRVRHGRNFARQGTLARSVIFRQRSPMHRLQARVREGRARSDGPAVPTRAHRRCTDGEVSTRRLQHGCANERSESHRGGVSECGRRCAMAPGAGWLAQHKAAAETSRAASTACCVHNRARAHRRRCKSRATPEVPVPVREQAAAATDSRREVRRTAVTAQEIACAQARCEGGVNDGCAQSLWAEIGWHDHGGRRRGGSVRACNSTVLTSVAGFWVFGWCEPSS